MRVKNATATYNELGPLVFAVREWLDHWIEGVSSSTPTFRDPITSLSTSSREIFIRHLTSRADQIVSIVNREQRKTQPREEGGQPRVAISNEGNMAALHNAYEGPGPLCPEWASSR